MTTAMVVWESVTGVTERFAEEIASYLKVRGLDASSISIADCDERTLDRYDLVLFGCWTSGLLVIGQHPDKEWVEFVGKIPGLRHPRVALFTTYKVATGSMFRRMRRALEPLGARVELELKSRDGRLSDEGRKRLDAWMALAPTEGGVPG